MAQSKPQWQFDQPYKIGTSKLKASSVPTPTIKLTLHQFIMGDVEDPQLYAAAPIYDWQQTEKGKWCMENALDEIKFYITQDYQHYGYRVALVGTLSDIDHTYFQLKWGSK